MAKSERPSLELSGASSDEQVNAICQTVHEALRTWALACGQPEMPHWDNASERMKRSTLESVKSVLANPEQTVADQHRQWVNQMTASGWIHGPEKDEALKTHPMLIPFDALPEHEQKKDALLVAIVRALA